MTITETQSWKALAAHFEAVRGLHLRDLFQQDPQRAESFRATFEDLLLDYSKNRVTAETMRLLFALAREAGVEAQRDAMFAGRKIL